MADAPTKSELVKQQALWELELERFEEAVKKEKERIKASQNRWWNWRIQIKLVRK